MHIENLDIDDFGCFNRARIENLEEGLTVIAGPQRAGKTTFMQAVRRLGYGISRGDQLPPAADRYDLTADVVVDGHQYQLSIDGYAGPDIDPLDGGPERDVRELFGGLSATHYQQLYTISLDELRRVPRDLSDEANLSAILLGAAYGDILDIPKVRETFADRASDIGGVRASARGVYQMKEPMKRIQNGIEAREAAVEQVEEHERVDEKRNETVDRINELEENIKKLETEETRLEAVLSNHDEYTKLRELQDRLDGVNEENLEEFPTEDIETARSLQTDLRDKRNNLKEARDKFTTLVKSDDPSSLRQKLLEKRSKLHKFASEKSGWRERVNSLQKRRRDLEQRRQNLRHRVGDLSSAWDDDLERVKEVDTDLISNERLQSLMKRRQETTTSIRETKRAISELENRLQKLEERINSVTEPDTDLALNDHYPTVAGGVLASILIGIGAGTVGGPVLGVIVTAISLLITGAYVVSKIETHTLSDKGVSIDTLRAERDKVDSELNSKKNTLESQNEKVEEVDSQLTDISNELGLPDDVPKSVLQEFYEEVIELQDKVRSLEEDEDSLKDQAETLRSDLKEVNRVLVDLGVVDGEPGDQRNEPATLFSGIERANEQFEAAEATAKAEKAVERVENELLKVVEGWSNAPPLSAGEPEQIEDTAEQFVERGEKVRDLKDAVIQRDETRERLRKQLSVSSVEQALKPYRPEESKGEWHIAAFERVVEEYEDLTAIEDRLETVNKRQKKFKDERDNEIEQRIKFEDKLESLASDDDIREAHATIETGRKQLEQLAEQYASSRIAEYLLDELHERFIARTTGPLLEDASKILERITDETYTSIDSEDEFDNVDFVAQLKNGSTQRTGELSRATAEQLFLAVRLARIRHHDRSLPVLLDDSLTNFDPRHVERTLNAISELADETQVFLLTCHPSMLDRIESQVTADYWCLDDGCFEGPYEETTQSQKLLNGTLSTSG